MRHETTENEMIGPTVTIRKSCSACECERSEGYAVQGDSGSHVYCAHPAVEKKFIGSDDWKTPDWCPAEVGADGTAQPVEFLLGGARLKLSFQQEECESCGASSAHFRTVPMDQYAEELQGQWVALVPAENDRHLRMVAAHNVEFSGGAPLYGAASAATKGYASGDKNE